MPAQHQTAQSCPHCGHVDLTPYDYSRLAWCSRCGSMAEPHSLTTVEPRRWREPLVLRKLRNIAQVIVVDIERLRSDEGLDLDLAGAMEAQAEIVASLERSVHAFVRELKGGRRALEAPLEARHGALLELEPVDVRIYNLEVGDIVDFGGSLGRHEVTSTDFPLDGREPFGWNVTFGPLEHKDLEDLVTSTWSQEYSREQALRRVARRVP